MKPSKVMESGFPVGLTLSAVPLASPFPGRLGLPICKRGYLDEGIPLVL